MSQTAEGKQTPDIGLHGKNDHSRGLAYPKKGGAQTGYHQKNPNAEHHQRIAHPFAIGHMENSPTYRQGGYLILILRGVRRQGT